MTLQGKAALITGAASGIGRAIALLFAREGASVALFDRNEESGRTIARDIKTAGGRALFVGGDVSHEADCQRAAEATAAAYGGIAVLVNNAGIIHRATILETDPDIWDRVMQVNVKAIYLLSRAAIPIMALAGGGSIINTASNWGLVGGPRAAAYCASKGAVVLLTRAMAIDHGPQKIRVNCICPGDTDTPMLRREADQLGAPVETFLAESASCPLGRIARPEEIAEAARYLASDAASFVTGAALVVDGGFTAG